MAYDRNDRNDKSDRRRGGNRKRTKRKVCAFCMDKATAIDYKDINKLRKYVTEKGKILPRRISGNCAKHQRMLTVLDVLLHISLTSFVTSSILLILSNEFINNSSKFLLLVPFIIFLYLSFILLVDINDDITTIISITTNTLNPIVINILY